MQEKDIQEADIKQKYTKKKVLLILVALIVLVGAGSSIYLVKASDNPSFCSACHIMQPYYQSWHESSLLANKHAAANVTCHDCHESSLAIQAEEGIKFVTGNYQVPLEKRVFSNDFCLQCHSDLGMGAPKGTTFEAAKVATDFEESNPHDSHNGEQNCNQCHNMHQESKVMCAQCHMFEWTDKLDAGWE